jgi:hypothetical protein
VNAHSTGTATNCLAAVSLTIALSVQCLPTQGLVDRLPEAKKAIARLVLNYWIERGAMVVNFMRRWLPFNLKH